MRVVFIKYRSRVYTLCCGAIIGVSNLPYKSKSVPETKLPDSFLIDFCREENDARANVGLYITVRLERTATAKSAWKSNAELF